jgi:hypothetical protein
MPAFEAWHLGHYSGSHWRLSIDDGVYVNYSVQEHFLPSAGSRTNAAFTRKRLSQFGKADDFAASWWRSVQSKHV